VFRRLICNNEDVGKKILYYKDTVECQHLTCFGQKAEGSTWSCCKVGTRSEVLKQLFSRACGKIPGSFYILLHEVKV
jgi:hypothetical protein